MLPQLITYDDAIASVEWSGAVEALRAGHLLSRAEIGDTLLRPAAGTLLTRAAYIEGLGYGVKAATICDANIGHGLPTIHAAMIVFDPYFGKPKAIIDGKLVTDFKTAADSVLGASLLARKDSRRLLIVGAGSVAKNVAQAYSKQFPDLERISVWARRPEMAEALASECSAEVPLVAVDNLEAAMAEADIISTATMARSPVLPGDWVAPGTHVDLIGAYTAEMREADDTLISKGSLYVDSRATTIGHIGELMIPMASGVISDSDVLGDLYDLVPSTTAVRVDDDEITIFKNGGGAHLDLMIASYISSLLGPR
jgi:ornithine cyclodeaminase/alanine dehydrogenase-like protein (mu-crystallin family)